MKPKIKKKRLLQNLKSIIYGIIIYNIVPYWSFDFEALVTSIEYYRLHDDFTFLGLLLNNTILLVIWDVVFSFLSPTASIQALYGFAAGLRLYTFLNLFNSIYRIPVFLASLVVMDLNTCRYSIVVSILLLLYRKYNKYILGILSFPLHLLAPAWILLLKIHREKKSIMIGLMAFLSIASIYFTRHFTILNPTFPRITFIYLTFSIVLIMTFYKPIKKFLFNYVIIFFSLIYLITMGISIDYAYYYRITDLIFQTLLIHILICTSRKNFQPNGYQHLILSSVLFTSTLYSFALIGGNIWRFF